MNNIIWDTMSNEELCELYQQQADDQLFEYFVDRNIGLGKMFINKYKKSFPGYNDEFEQIIYSSMWLGLKLWKKDKDCKFSTFYYYCILKEITYFIRKFNIIHIPAYILADFDKYKEQIYTVFNCRSLNFPDSRHELGESEGPDLEIIDTLVDDSLNPEEECNKNFEREQLLNMLYTSLSPRQYRVMIMWLGLSEHHRYMTLEEIGREFGVTRERIRQIISKTAKKLKPIIGDYIFVDTEKYNILSEDKPKLRCSNYVKKKHRR